MKKIAFKTLVLALCLCCSNILSAQTQSKMMNPLSTYIERNDLKDPVALTYVYDRCIGLFQTMAIGSKNETGIEAEKFHANAQAAYADIASAEAMLISRTTKDREEALKSHIEAVKRIVKIYTKHMDEILDIGQDLMSDDLIGGDLNVCSVVLKNVRQKSKK